MCILELITLLLDVLGLVLISLFLFFVPEPTTFVLGQEVGIITSLEPVADAINEILRNFRLIRRMRIELSESLLRAIMHTQYNISFITNYSDPEDPRILKANDFKRELPRGNPPLS